VKLSELAEHVSGEIVGSGETSITGVAPIEEAQTGHLVFVLGKKFLPQALGSSASAMVAPLNSNTKGKPAILVKDPRSAMAKILSLFAPKKTLAKGIHETAIIPKSCKVGRGSYIGPYVVLGENVSIGKDCIVHSHVSLYDNTVVGDRVIIHSGARLGVDGFGFVPQGEEHVKIPQIGNVVIEDDVEIYANVCISRATLGSTIIGSGTKIDNLTHIAHNCKIGKNCAIVSLVGVAGSVTLKDHVYVAGQAGFTGHLTVGENTIVMARAGVTKDSPANSVVSGFPAQNHQQEMAFQAALRRLAKKSKE
jgi:UDP-3-O-[3-hydroxymyristoyl] glucosamine N-acyltransferase